jgi:hypothetical protein
MADGNKNVFRREAEGPLPDGLKCLAMELDVCTLPRGRSRHREDKPPWKAASRGELYAYNHDDDDEDGEGATKPPRPSGHELLGLYTCTLRTIGRSNYAWAGQKTLFGSRSCVRIRFDLIASETLLRERKIIDKAKSYYLRRIFSFEFGEANGLSIGEIRTELRDAIPPWEDDLTIYEEFKNIYEPSFASGRDEEFRSGDFARWAIAAQATEQDFERLERLADACSRNVVGMGTTLKRAEQDEEEVGPTRFLVPGLIPRGSVTLLLANRKVGKSALMLELAVTVAQDSKRPWAGFPVESAQGHAVYLMGEDSKEETRARIKMMTGGEMPLLLWPSEAEKGLLAALDDLKDHRVSLLVVDPSRKFYSGDEDGSDAANSFFNPLMKFAQEKNAAVVTTHHLKRGAQPHSVADVAKYIRGSGVFLDRPRVVLAMHRAGNETQFGVASLDGMFQHNFRQDVMFSGVRRLRRDDASFRHIPIDAPDGNGVKPATVADLDRVLAAANSILVQEGKLTRTGKAGLFERKPSGLAGMSRATVRGAIDNLISHGRLNCDSEGLITLPAQQPDNALADLIG